MLAAIRRHYDEAYVNWNEVTIIYCTVYCPLMLS